MKAKEIERCILKLGGNIKNEDEGFLFGNPDQEIIGIVITWKPTLPAMKFAVDNNCNFIISHEILFDFEYTLPQPAYIQSALDWKANQRRKECLEENSLIIYHWHGGMLRVKGAMENYMKILGLEMERRNVKEMAKEEILFYIEQSIGVLKKSVTVEKLAEKVKHRLKLKRVRVAGDLRKKVKRVGLAMGGDSLFTNMSTIDLLLSKGAEVIVGGESDAYAANFIMDSGTALIETDHPLSDNICIYHSFEALKKRRLPIPVYYYEHSSPWQYV